VKSKEEVIVIQFAQQDCCAAKCMQVGYRREKGKDRKLTNPAVNSHADTSESTKRYDVVPYYVVPLMSARLEVFYKQQTVV
jgi:hypothetical protein